MSILPDHEIARLAREEAMIEPFEPKLVRAHPDGSRVLSYGLSSFGYDLRVADEFKIFRPRYDGESVVDPKALRADLLEDFQGPVCIIPPNSYALCRSLEYFRIPRDLLVVVVGKSSYARSGLIVNVTPGEPGWEGHWTIEISNAAPLPAKLYANEGIAQCLFFRGTLPPETTYADRAGKYQGQRGITLPRM